MDILIGLRRMVISNKIYPIIFGSSLKNIGVQKLLDCVIDFLPNPAESKVKKKVAQGVNLGYCYKTYTDIYMGSIAIVRMYSGRFESGLMVYNKRTQQYERIQRIVEFQADNKIDINCCIDGDIVGLIGIKSAITGDTLSLENNITPLEPLETPNFVLSVSIEPVDAINLERLPEILQLLSKEDPSLNYYYVRIIIYEIG